MVGTHGLAAKDEICRRGWGDDRSKRERCPSKEGIA